MAGKKEARPIIRVNRALRRWFEDRGLALEEIWTPGSDDLEAQNLRLKELQVFVLAYEQHGDRDELGEADAI